MENKQQITKCIRELVHLEQKYTHQELINLSGISRGAWFDRLKNDNWKKTEILALKYLGVLKD